jgi:hypothetical protein
MRIVPNRGHDCVGATTPNIIRGNFLIRFRAKSGHGWDTPGMSVLTQSGQQSGQERISAAHCVPDHGGLHCTALCLVKGVNFGHGTPSLEGPRLNVDVRYWHKADIPEFIELH